MNYRRTLLGPIYRIQGVNATLTVRGVIYGSVRAIDRTTGVAVPGPIGVETTKPVVTLRAGDLLDLGCNLDDLDDGTIELNRRLWTILDHREMPSPNGVADGEVWLFLESASGAAAGGAIGSAAVAGVSG